MHQDKARRIFTILLSCGKLAKLVPYPLTLIPGSVIGLVFILFFPGRFNIAMQNLQIVFPRKHFLWKLKIIILALINHGVTFWELLWSPALTPVEIQKKFAVSPKGPGLFNAEGIIVVLIHSGSWEPALLGLGKMLPNTVYVYRRLHSPLAENLMKLIRQSQGTKVIASKGAVQESKGLLAHKQNIFFAIDHHFTAREGVDSIFFDKKVSGPPGPAVLQAKTGRPVVVMGFFRNWWSGRYEVFTHCILQAESNASREQADQICSMTQAYFKQLEQLVTMHPEQYWWFHRIFKKSHTY